MTTTFFRKIDNKDLGFTIVELLIVVVVIAILAAIVIVAYNGITSRSRDTAIQADVNSFAKVIENDKTTDSVYPSSASAANGGKGLTSGSGNTITYTVDGAGTYFCLQASKTGGQSYYSTTNKLSPTAGVCSGVAGVPNVGVSNVMQAVTNASCPASRTRVVDARDGRSYWVQQLADGKCWMLTNLAYAGGGPNTFGDVKTLTNGAGTSGTFTVPSFYIPPNANVTLEPSNPSTSTDGGVTNTQYGYLYNWCGAMGGQATAACLNAATPAPNTSISICPSGWRLPVGNSGEFGALNTAVNGGAINTDAGLRTTWLGQRSGTWNFGFADQNLMGLYWPSTQSSSNQAYALSFSAGTAYPYDFFTKDRGFAVRCVAV